MARPRLDEPHLSMDRILESALEQLERAGVAGLSFRSLAKALNVTPMAIAHHAGSKEQLLQALTAHVFGKVSLSEPEASPRDLIRILMTDYCRQALRHPALVQLVFADPARYFPGPLEKITSRLSSLLEQHCPDEAPALVIRDIVVDYTHGFALSAAAALSAGITDAPGLEEYRRGLDWILSKPV